MSGLHRRLILGAASNWLVFAANILISFFLTPWLTNSLGQKPYGIWVFMESILACFTLFDLGIAASLVRYVARFRVQQDQQQLDRLMSSCIALFAALGLGIFVLGLGTLPLVLHSGRAAGIDDAQLIEFMLLMLVNLGLTLPMSAFPAALDGLERYSIKSLIRFTILIVRTVAMIYVVRQSADLVGLAWVYLITGMAENALLIAVTFRVLPRLRIGWSHVHRDSLRLVRGYSVNAFLIMVSGRASIQGGVIIVGLMLDASEVVFFAIALRLVDYSRALLRAATGSMTGTISTLDAKDDREAIRRICVHAIRLSVCMMLPIQTGLIVFGRPFVEIWMKSPEYGVETYPSLFLLAWVLVPAAAQSVCARILYGIGELRWLVRISMIEAASFLVLGPLAILSFHIEGLAAISTLTNVTSCIAVILCTSHKLGLSKARLAGAFAGPTVLFVPTLAYWLIPTPIRGWSDLLIQGSIGMVMYAAVVVGYGAAKRMGRVRAAEVG